jgi:hypothetical protein
VHARRRPASRCRQLQALVPPQLGTTALARRGLYGRAPGTILYRWRRNRLLLVDQRTGRSCRLLAEVRSSWLGDVTQHSPPAALAPEEQEEGDEAEAAWGLGGDWCWEEVLGQHNGAAGPLLGPSGTAAAGAAAAAGPGPRAAALRQGPASPADKNHALALAALSGGVITRPAAAPCPQQQQRSSASSRAAGPGGGGAAALELSPAAHRLSAGLGSSSANARQAGAKRRLEPAAGEGPEQQPPPPPPLQLITRASQLPRPLEQAAWLRDL